jgi:hypothetical protein
MTKRKAYNWKEIIPAQERSGKSVHEFCKEKGITANLFYVNRKKLHAQGFVEVEIREAGVKKKPIVLTYQGIRIEIEAGFCKEALREVLAVIGGIE